MVQLFEELNSVEQDSAAADATPEDQALREVLNEIDDIARATLGSITIATMRKLVDRPPATAGGVRRPARRGGGTSRAFDCGTTFISQAMDDAEARPTPKNRRLAMSFIVRCNINEKPRPGNP